MSTNTATLAKSEPAASRAPSEHVPEPSVFGQRKSRPLFEASIVKRAIRDSFVKLDPRHQVRNPVMFVVEVGSVLTTALFPLALAGTITENPWFILAVSLWLWFTVLFANFAEAMAEGRGKAQADSLRAARQDIQAKQLAAPRRDAQVTPISGARLCKGDCVLVEAGDQIPGDG
jgi:K+-transporting ATPase ATPase B chain